MVYQLADRMLRGVGLPFGLLGRYARDRILYRDEPLVLVVTDSKLFQ
jgi:hypothetical protein